MLQTRNNWHESAQTLERSCLLSLANSLTPREVEQTTHPASTSLLAFTQHTKPDYQTGWHHRVLCDYLDRFIAGELPRLMVFMPPRHGKSELVSRRLPAYILGHDPNATIISASYSADLSSRMNRDVQRIIDSPLYASIFPETQLFGKNVRATARGSYLRNSDIFEVVGYSGVYRSSGVGGGITGMGGKYLIIDDPIKNREEADSATQRETLWEWYTSTFYTRLEKQGAILITLTRWHEDDLAGRLLTMAENDPRADQWTVLRLPAVFDPADRDPEDIRADDEPLWPEKYGVEQLATIRATVGSRQWDALYQQRPRPAEGALFKRQWFPVVDAAPKGLKWFRYWDLAATTHTTSDYTASGAVGMASDGSVFIRDMVHGRWEWPDARSIIIQTMQSEPGVIHGVEDALHGLAAVQELRRERQVSHIPFKAVHVDRDKVSRANAWAPRAEEGKVKLVRGPWIPGFLDELCAFPLGTHDDRVDTISGGMELIAKGATPIASPDGMTRRSPWQ
jgi:predicted phage terminase large subunit-like protein